MRDPVLSREAVRELDRRAIEEYGIPSIVLMENAGRACAEEVLRVLGAPATGPVTVLCGPGNNGGDGLVIARTLVNRGVPVQVVFVSERKRFEGSSEDFRTNLRLWRGLGREVECLETPPALERLGAALSRSELAVDALFGTGLTRPLTEPYLTAIRLLNANAGPVLAVDLPSGLDANTGEVLGEAVRASVTVTFVAKKPGFERGQGPRLCGRVVVAEIGIPRTLVEEAAGRSAG